MYIYIYIHIFYKYTRLVDTEVSTFIYIYVYRYNMPTKPSQPPTKPVKPKRPKKLKPNSFVRCCRLAVCNSLPGGIDKLRLTDFPKVNVQPFETYVQAASAPFGICHAKKIGSAPCLNPATLGPFNLPTSWLTYAGHQSDLLPDWLEAFDIKQLTGDIAEFVCNGRLQESQPIFPSHLQSSPTPKSPAPPQKENETSAYALHRLRCSALLMRGACCSMTSAVAGRSGPLPLRRLRYRRCWGLMLLILIGSSVMHHWPCHPFSPHTPPLPPPRPQPCERPDSTGACTSCSHRCSAPGPDESANLTHLGATRSQETPKSNMPSPAVLSHRIFTEFQHTVDGRNPAPPKKPWNDDSPHGFKVGISQPSTAQSKKWHVARLTHAVVFCKWCCCYFPFPCCLRHISFGNKGKAPCTYTIFTETQSLEATCQN